MIAKFIDSVIELLAKPTHHRLAIQAAVFLLIISPTIAVATFSYFETKKDLTNAALTRRGALQYLAATTLKEKFDRLEDISVALATRVRFRDLIKQEEWQEAVKILEAIPKDLPFIERLFITDTKGTLMADTPALPGVRGQNFAVRDWYKGVTTTDKPYISEIYRRTAQPQYNVVATAAPIKDSSGVNIGILVMQVRLETLFEWLRDIEVGPLGFVYVVDRNGNLAAHPKFPPQGEIVDFSSVPAVEKALKGEQGVQILYNSIEKEERVSAYGQVPGYGWGVVVQQPTKTAFESRDATLRNIFIVYSLVLILTVLLTLLLIRVIRTIIDYRERERLFLESIGDGVVAIDREWNITLWNSSAGEISGFSREEVIGKPFRSIIKFLREQDRTENIAFIEETMLFGRHAVMEDNTVLVRKDGTEIPVGDSAAPIMGGGGKVNGAIIIFRDISKEHEARRLKSDFAYSSHQLRTPVTEALWHLETALDERESAKIMERLRMAYSSVKNLQRLSDQLVTVSEIDQGDVIPQLEKVKLSEIFDELIRSTSEKSKEKQVVINVPPISATEGIKTDKNIFMRILSEILENAISYSPEKGVVNINIKSEEDNLLVEIQDRGIGIPVHEQPLVFTKFFRAHNVPHEITGTGLGLYIAREYVKLLKGKIWFKSEEGKGTTFWFELPA